jgi:DNA primase
VLALDADTAGQMATLRGIETLREALADDAAPVPVARDLVRFERRLSADIRILTLPAGEDPDSLLRKEPAAWPGLVEQAEPLIDYVLRAVLGALDLTQPRAKSEAVDRLAPMLHEVGDAIQQAHYINILSRRLGLAERVIEDKIRAVRRGSLQAARQAIRAEAAAARVAVAPEDYLLGLLLRYPEAAAGLIEMVTPDDFTDARNRLLWEQLRARLPHDGAAAAERLQATLDEALAERFTTLLDRQRAAKELYLAQAREEALQALKTARQRRERQLREYYQSMMREAEASGAELAEVQQQVAALADGSRHRAFYPRPSPYFKDIRDKE